MSFSSVSGKNWLFKRFDSSDVIKFSENYSLTETVAKLLSIRKDNIENISLFLNPKIKNFLINPHSLKGMEKAVDRIYSCISKNQLIGILETTSASSSDLLNVIIPLIDI